MATTKLDKLEARIVARKQALAQTGHMRPGKLSVQYRNPEEQKTPFNQISYTLDGKSRSEYVRSESLDAVQRELAEYKRFKDMVEKLIRLSLDASRLRHARTRTRSIRTAN